MSSNAKIVLRKKPNKEGLYPLAIRITKNRRSTYQYVGHYIDIEDWDDKNIRVKKSHGNSDSLNSLLSQELSEVSKALISLQSEKKDASAVSFPCFELFKSINLLLTLNSSVFGEAYIPAFAFYFTDNSYRCQNVPSEVSHFPDNLLQLSHSKLFLDTFFPNNSGIKCDFVLLFPIIVFPQKIQFEDILVIGLFECPIVL